MIKTSPTLLERLRSPDDQQAWARFVELYLDLLLYWGRSKGLQEQDAADLAQEVLALLVQKLPSFRYENDGSFRGWLKTVTLNKLSDLRAKRKAAALSDDAPAWAELAQPEADAFWDGEDRDYLIARAMQVMRAEFEPVTYQVCAETFLHGRPPAEVAAELGISPGSVHTARSRVLKRLRQELAGLID